MKAKTTEGPMTASRLRPGDKVKPLRADSEVDGPKERARWRRVIQVDAEDGNGNVLIVFQPRSRHVSGFTGHIIESDKLVWCQRVESEEKP
jgi:hypothetical protein